MILLLIFLLILFTDRYFVFFFFFNDTATTEIYTLSLHDALPICWDALVRAWADEFALDEDVSLVIRAWSSLGYTDRKSTRLNSSHLVISYAVFCLKKKKNEYYSRCLVSYCRVCDCSHSDDNRACA